MRGEAYAAGVKRGEGRGNSGRLRARNEGRARRGNRQRREGEQFKHTDQTLSNTDQSKNFSKSYSSPSSKYGKVKFCKTKINVQLLKHCSKGVF